MILNEFNSDYSIMEQKVYKQIKALFHTLLQKNYNS